MMRELLDIGTTGQEQPIPGVSLSIVVPAFNENENIADAIRTIVAGIPDSVRHHEIIIVDDGSRDGTPDMIRSLAASDRNIRGIFHEVNRGKGAALASAFREARMEWVLFTDADLQISMGGLSAFIAHTTDYDIIIGYRRHRRDPLSRRFFSGVYAALIRLTLGFGTRDLNCPFKLTRKSLLDRLDLRSNGFFIDTELIYRALQNNARIKELPVACQPRQKGESTVRFRHVLETVRELYALLGRKNTDAR